MVNNNDDKWLELRKNFCNLRNEFSKTYFYKQKKLGKTKAKKYDFNVFFINLAGPLDSLVGSSYPHEINEIKEIPIIYVFYNTGDDDTPSSIMDPPNGIKSHLSSV